jgi:pre-60S factor REI1
MIDKSHCKLPYDGTHPEVEDFYLFGHTESGTDGSTETHSDTMAEDQSEEDEDEEDGAWEEVEDSDEVAAIEQQGQQLVLHQETAATRRAAGRAALAESEPIVGDTVQELVLGDGRRLGHRSLARYYKQSVRPQVRTTRRCSFCSALQIA